MTNEQLEKVLQKIVDALSVRPRINVNFHRGRGFQYYFSFENYGFSIVIPLIQVGYPLNTYCTIIDNSTGQSMSFSYFTFSSSLSQTERFLALTIDRQLEEIRNAQQESEQDSFLRSFI